MWTVELNSPPTRLGQILVILCHQNVPSWSIQGDGCFWKGLVGFEKPYVSDMDCGKNTDLGRREVDLACSCLKNKMHPSLLCVVAHTLSSSIQYVALYPTWASEQSWSCVNVVTRRGIVQGWLCRDLESWPLSLFSNFCYVLCFLFGGKSLISVAFTNTFINTLWDTPAISQSFLSDFCPTSQPEDWPGGSVCCRTRQQECIQVWAGYLWKKDWVRFCLWYLYSVLDNWRCHSGKSNPVECGM